jgi:predicted O-methyltransferase YrrM
MAFIDADKKNYINYYERCLVLLRSGGLLLVDNVFWHGKVLEEESKQDEDTSTIHQLNKKISTDTRVTSTMLSVADGVTLCKKI